MVPFNVAGFSGLESSVVRREGDEYFVRFMDRLPPRSVDVPGGEVARWRQALSNHMDFRNLYFGGLPSPVNAPSVDVIVARMVVVHMYAEVGIETPGLETFVGACALGPMIEHRFPPASWDDDEGYCYQLLFKSEHRPAVTSVLGRKPEFWRVLFYATGFNFQLVSTQVVATCRGGVLHLESTEKPAVVGYNWWAMVKAVMAATSWPFVPISVGAFRPLCLSDPTVLEHQAARYQGRKSHVEMIVTRGGVVSSLVRFFPSVDLQSCATLSELVRHVVVSKGFAAVDAQPVALCLSVDGRVAWRVCPQGTVLRTFVDFVRFLVAGSQWPLIDYSLYLIG